jgi:hypothetical protein
MPVQPCQEEDRPGFRWGESGKCYTYEPGNERARLRARLKAEAQGEAVKAAQNRRERHAR